MKARKTTMSVSALRKPFARAFVECPHTQKQSTTSPEVLEATSECSQIALKHFSRDAKAVDNKFRSVGSDFRMFPNRTEAFLGWCQSGRQNRESHVAQLEHQSEKSSAPLQNNFRQFRKSNSGIQEFINSVSENYWKHDQSVFKENTFPALP